MLCKCNYVLFLILNIKQSTKIIKYQVDNPLDKLFFDNEGNRVSFMSEESIYQWNFKYNIN